MSKRELKFLLLMLFVFLIFINYSFIDSFLEKNLDFENDYEEVFIEKVVDGDTVKTKNDTIRLLGINTPEKDEKYYLEAKEFLEELVFNETILTKSNGVEDKDKYRRKLRYLFLKNQTNVNVEIVKNGLGNIYYPKSRDSFYSQLHNAWNDCLISNSNLCERSDNYCIILDSWDFYKQEIVFENICSFDVELTNWSLKDEGRKKFFFPEFILKSKERVKVVVGEKENTNKTLYWKGEKYVWTKTGDSFFLRDETDLLVLWNTKNK